MDLDVDVQVGGKMDFMTFIRYTVAIVETVFLVMTIFYLVKGVKTKNYDNLKKYGAIICF